MMLKQRKLDEALRVVASSGRVNVDKLMASTIHTLINYNIEFTPATTSQNAAQDCGLKYILLKPENEPAEKQRVINSVQSKKRDVKFKVHKFQHDYHDVNVKHNTGNKETVGKKRSGSIGKRQQKEQRQMSKSRCFRHNLEY